MAFQKTFQSLRKKFTLPNAYYRVVKFDHMFFDDQSPLTITVDVYPSEEARKQKAEPMERMGHNVKFEDIPKYFSEEILAQEGMTPRKAAYIYLQTLPEYSDVRNV